MRRYCLGEDVDPLSRRSLLGAGVGAAAFGLYATTAPAAARQIDLELVAHWTKLRGVLSRHDATFGPLDVLGAVRHIHQARLAQACAAADEPDRAASEGLEALNIARATRSDLTCAS